MTYVPAQGDIGLVQIRGGVGLAIRVGQWFLAEVDRHEIKQIVGSASLDWADYQHAFVYLGNGQLIEAEPGGARIRPLSEYDDYDVYWCQSISKSLTADQRAKIASVARGLDGIPYSFLDYFALTMHKLHIWVPGLRHFIQRTGHAICSQLADMAYETAGVQLWDDGRWAGDVDPLDLYLRDQELAN